MLVYEILKYCHSELRLLSSAVHSCGAVHYAAQGGSTF